MKVKVLALLLVAGVLSACETVKGAGEDLQSAGAAVSQEASRAQAR